LIVCAGREADLLREPLPVRLPSPRRKALMERFAWLAAGRLAALEDPMGVAELAWGLSED
jgi:hypothetical protein